MGRKYQSGGEYSHGYESFFDNYLSQLEHAQHYESQESYQEDVDEYGVEEYARMLSEEVPTDDMSSQDALFDNFIANIDSKLAEFEDRIASMAGYGIPEDFNFSDSGFDSAPNIPWSGMRHELDTDAIRNAQAMAESSNNPNAEGPKTKYGTAKGLFQFIDATWKEYMPWEGADVFDPKANAMARDRYMYDLINMFGNDIRKALAAYNYGPGNVRKLITKYGDAWEKGLPSETKGYLKKILKQFGGVVQQEPEGHGYEQLFSNYMSYLENAYAKQQQQQEEEVEDLDEDEYIKSLTNQENSEENTTFALKLAELEEIYTQRFEKLDEMLSLLEIGTDFDMMADFDDDTDYAAGKSVTDFDFKAFKPNYGKLKEKKAFILHHTGMTNFTNPTDDLATLYKVFQERNVATQWVIDRQGNIIQVLPDGAKGQHIRTGRGIGAGLNNSNTEGVEIMAADDSDILPVQKEAALRLVKRLGYRPEQIFGHGEINTHKQATEGSSAKKYIIENYNVE